MQLCCVSEKLGYDHSFPSASPDIQMLFKVELLLSSKPCCLINSLHVIMDVLDYLMWILLDYIGIAFS